MTGYETKTMEQLFETYADANTLVNRQDVGRRQTLIRAEIRRRVDTAFELPNETAGAVVNKITTAKGEKNNGK